jgi:hypothetical protein
MLYKTPAEGARKKSDFCIAYAIQKRALKAREKIIGALFCIAYAIQKREIGVAKA